MPIWDGAIAVLLERSSDGNTATVLGAGDAVLASCDDAGTVIGADGSTLMTAAFSAPSGAHSDAPGADVKRLRARVEVAGADGTTVGTLVVRRFTVTPFSKKITIAMLDPGGAEIGDLSTVDRKGPRAGRYVRRLKRGEPRARRPRSRGSGALSNVGR